jgi:hypothetical protein
MGTQNECVVMRGILPVNGGLIPGQWGGVIAGH